MAAPRTTPVQPNTPVALPGGIKAPSGLPDVTQFAVVTEETAQAMNSRITISFTATITSLNRAVSRMPTTSTAVTATMTNMAGRLKIAPVDDQTPASPS